MHNIVDIIKLRICCEYVDNRVQPVNRVMHKPNDIPSLAPSYFYTYKQHPTTTSTKLTNKSENQ